MRSLGFRSKPILLICVELMTFLTQLVFSHARRNLPLWSSSMLKLTAVSSAVLLTACANVQLPPWSAMSSTAPGQSVPNPAPASAATPATSQPVAPAPNSQLSPTTRPSSLALQRQPPSMTHQGLASIASNSAHTQKSAPGFRH